MRELAKKQNQDLLLIDSGDKIDGSGISDISKIHGQYSTPIFVKQNYDILTIGNHELYLLESSIQEFKAVQEYFPDNYITSNVEFNNNGTFVPFGSKFKYFETEIKKTRILAFGFLFDFKRFNSGTKVTPIKEEIEKQWFKDTLKQYQGKVDLIVIAGHTPIDHNWPEFYHLHKHLRKYYPNTIIQYFGGHSHIRDFSIFDKNSTGIQSGRYCETVGWVSIDLNKKDLETKERFSRSYIDFNLNSFHKHSKKDIKNFDSEKGIEVTKLVAKTRKDLKLNTQIGTVHSNYYVDYVPIDHPKNIFNLITNQVLNDLPGSGERIIIINTGSIRYDLYKGPYTIDSQYIVSPFENKWVNLTVPKSIATKVAEKLNEASYISTTRLKPPHHYLKKEIVYSDEAKDKKLSKGYVTHDDFGSNGDDTPHKPVINFDIPNVVQSVQLNNEIESFIDLVFYDFITPNIKWALKELNYEIQEGENPTNYSEIFLGKLLNNYIAEKSP
ncbi:uncharacterized protein KGF55_004818 [Candida pseudojiufengensis]|uniref:uncharacterized protein n=1 Tax=Candida pseudojiufengensis TaxID=497109 RepID=UPI0022243BEB|nr:uncharacterized protein KGF55_004818 [Candida pseudojiufengensis]KAI5960095.1 hypothetical protein KGF55_004818 [Candida pseudojiufengensis]